MARKNKRRRDQHPKRGRRTRPVGELHRAAFDTNYTHEDAFDGGWHVRQVQAWRAVKIYTCPGCLRPIPQGQPHVVTWRSDWLMGDDDAGQQRRHWHTACWNNRRQDLRY